MKATKQDIQDNTARRKRYCVDRKVQSALTRRMVYQWFVFLFVASLALPLFNVMMRGDFSRPLAQTLRDTASDFVILAVTFLCLLPYFVLDTYKQTNRFAGPIYRLRNTMRSLLNGEKTPPLKFRQDDFWHELAEDFNALQAMTKAGDAAQLADEKPAAGAVHHTTAASV
jgi:hypothetical protein